MWDDSGCNDDADAADGILCCIGVLHSYLHTLSIMMIDRVYRSQLIHELAGVAEFQVMFYEAQYRFLALPNTLGSYAFTSNIPSSHQPQNP